MSADVTLRVDETIGMLGWSNLTGEEAVSELRIAVMKLYRPAAQGEAAE
jgi:hypothetical protein